MRSCTSASEQRASSINPIARKPNLPCLADRWRKKHLNDALAQTGALVVGPVSSNYLKLLQASRPANPIDPIPVS
jgi:hypothetical protein